MAISFAADDGTLNGTTAVTLVPAPGVSQQHLVSGVTIQNRDTAVVTIIVRKVSAGGTRQIWKGDLDVGDTFHILKEDGLILDDTGSTITAVMAAAAATTNPDWTSSWGVVS